MQFSVDGEVKQALIENYGKIEAIEGDVLVSLRAAHKTIKMVVNADGVTPANAIEEVNGVFRLVNQALVKADKVLIDGGKSSKITAQGTIDASNPKEGKSGGTVHLLGDRVELQGARIDASGDRGGGTVLVGGDYQGKGKVANAITTTMDPSSKIVADAYSKGDGGKVIVWADNTTLFDGKIFARGGSLGGNGGFVETSGKQDLGCEFGFVDTSAPMGKFGTWLLDPASIVIAATGPASIAQCSAPNCANANNRTISAATLQAAAANVALCAQNAVGSFITVSVPITMTNVGISLTMTAGSTNVGPINLNSSLTTKGALISLVGVVTVGGTGATLDTTNAGASPAGRTFLFLVLSMEVSH